uniref:Uncharacterized protein n=1 Tax=Rhizophora mucronata TaxID=61149 RepID=A0A2P2P0S0_RHIMU
MVLPITVQKRTYM